MFCDPKDKDSGLRRIRNNPHIAQPAQSNSIFVNIINYVRGDWTLTPKSKHKFECQNYNKLRSERQVFETS